MKIALRSNGKVWMLGLVALLALGSGCKQPVKPQPPTKPEVPPPARPTVTLTASSTSLNKGDSATLTWSSTNATQLNLTPGVGTVSPEGSTKVTPDSSTTYTVTATGPGGSADASVSITVNAPPPPKVEPKVPELTIDQIFARDVRDAYFDFNKSDIRADARGALTQTGEFLKKYPQVKVTIEGHCDERGTREYNLALGERRATAVKRFLTDLGIDARRVSTISYGKERPAVVGSTESSYAQNRRGVAVVN
jgi:peptidoglycan-associated lipoprotein